jgi:hypothetical protein
MRFLPDARSMLLGVWRAQVSLLVRTRAIANRDIQYIVDAEPSTVIIIPEGHV